MNMNEYQRRASLTVYPKEKAFEYLATGLAAEAGEVSGIVSKWIRGERGGEADIIVLRRELGDVLWFVSEMSRMLGSNLSMVAEVNLKKLEDRQKRHVLKGDGDNR